MAIDWSPLVAQQAVRNQGQQEAFYEMGDKVGNYFGNKPKGRSLLDKMTDQEGLFQGGFDDGKKRNRLFGRTRDAIEGSGKLGFNALKNASKLPGQFIKGIRDNKLNNGVSEERLDKKSLMDYIKGIKMPGPYRPDNKNITKYGMDDDGLSEESYDGESRDYPSEYKDLINENKNIQGQIDENNKYMDMKDNSSNSFDPNVQPIGPTDDANGGENKFKNLLDFSTDYGGNTEATGYKMSHGQQYGPTDYGAYPERYGGIETSDFNKDYSGESEFDGQDYSGETAERYNGNSDISGNSKSSQESMQMNMQNLQQQHPNLQLGSMQPGQSYSINLGNGQGMQSFQWGTGPMFGGQ
tara:strand:- start:3578 stop:4636 length:1059 start_codon:yes stop_codon:yes gene_type:complete